MSPEERRDVWSRPACGPQLEAAAARVPDRAVGMGIGAALAPLLSVLAAGGGGGGEVEGNPSPRDVETHVLFWKPMSGTV